MNIPIIFSGTIKRKPTMKPNIPLTSMTRQLKEMVDSNECSTYSNIPNDASVNASNNNTFAYTSTGMSKNTKINDIYLRNKFLILFFYRHIDTT